MFDWNDEELANIIWGEAGDSDDHIVPYPEASGDLKNKKEWHQEAAGHKLTEQKKPVAKNDFHGRKTESISNLNNRGGTSASGFGANSWTDLSLSNVVKSDQGCLGNEVYKNLNEICKYSSSRNGQLEKDAQIFQNADEGKEQGDFGDYGWANIGSFDDLDRIFSNDDPIFGHVNLDDADEVWSSSKNASNGPAPLSLDGQSAAGVLKNRSEPGEIKAEYVQRSGPSFSSRYVKIMGPASHYIQNAHAITTDLGYTGGRNKPTMEQQDMVGRTNSVTSGLAAENVAATSALTFKGFGQKNLLKAQKKLHGKQEGQAQQDFYINWSPSTNSPRQFENQGAPYTMQSSVTSILGQQKQLQGADSLYQNFTNPYVPSPVNGNPANTYPSMPLPSQAQPGDLTHQPLLSGFEVSTGVVNPMNSVDSVRPLIMTPQEKIEKLRRRQQMQAMLAIQKQQQQLGHQVPGTNKSMAQKIPLDIQSKSCDGADQEIDDLSPLPVLDPPIERDGSNTISVAVAADDYFVEDAILYRLQDIISKLDIQIRLCIRDSLFRLAQSATQRHYASDTSSTNKSSKEELEVAAREESNCQNRYGRILDIETETNPIDRTVAHLLFHRPLELPGNRCDKLESPNSAKVQFESKTSNLVNLPAACLSDIDLKNSQHFSHQGSKNPLFETEPMDEFKNNSHVDTSENASNNGPADVGGSPEV